MDPANQPDYISLADRMARWACASDRGGTQTKPAVREMTLTDRMRARTRTTHKKSH